jgi:hypothetical protein
MNFTKINGSDFNTDDLKHMILSHGPVMFNLGNNNHIWYLEAGSGGADASEVRSSVMSVSDWRMIFLFWTLF